MACSFLLFAVATPDAKHALALEATRKDFVRAREKAAAGKASFLQWGGFALRWTLASPAPSARRTDVSSVVKALGLATLPQLQSNARFSTISVQRTGRYFGSCITITFAGSPPAPRGTAVCPTLVWPRSDSSTATGAA